MFKSKGFTLVEVLLVIIIVGILAAIVIPRISYSKITAQNEACKATVSGLNSQLELYNMQEGTYPADIASLEPNYVDSVPATCERGTAYVYNTTTHRVNKHTH